jgi:hypothetical protein
VPRLWIVRVLPGEPPILGTPQTIGTTDCPVEAFSVAARELEPVTVWTPRWKLQLLLDRVMYVTIRRRVRALDDGLGGLAPTGSSCSGQQRKSVPPGRTGRLSMAEGMASAVLMTPLLSAGIAAPAQEIAR